MATNGSDSSIIPAIDTTAAAQEQSAAKDLYDGLYVEGDPGQYQDRADEVVKGVREVLADFGFDDALQGVYFTNGTGKNKDDQASMNGQGDLKIMKSALENLDASGYSVADTYHGLGTHEAGHTVVYELIKRRVMPGASKLAQSNARKSQKLEKAVIKEAAKRFGSNPKISDYGSTKFAEKVAEAVSDVYSHGSNAKAYSKVIVEVLKDINSGQYKPKI